MSAVRTFKRILFGRKLSTYQLRHTLLPKVLALPVFSSDPLSSNAYATQEILLVLAVAGAAATHLVVPIAVAVAILLATVVVSYRQTVQAYPGGGGAYIVSHENLGSPAGLVAAAALLIDYVLTVSVSIVAGVDAMVSAATHLADLKIPIALGLVGFVTLVNLRGAKESGTLFAIPTYGFVLSVYVMLATGFVKCLTGCPEAESAGLHLETERALSAFLILKAFSAGTTALTGVEAISNGVPAFRPDPAKNAATTLAMMGVMSISMFLGISWLARHTHVVVTEDAERTVVAQIAHAVFGGGPMFYVLQVMTAGILILAANTAYQDFPRLSSILAQDRFMPHQFTHRGDRLVFSNGIVVLAALAGLLIVVFDANLTRLIQLYLVGVFISFTLSQFGMVRYWSRSRDRGRRRRMAINGFGGTMTGMVFFVVVTTKFTGGAWMVVLAIPLLIALMVGVKRHYAWIDEQLRARGRPEDERPTIEASKVVVLASPLPGATVKATAFVRAFSPRDLRVLAFRLRERHLRELRARWKELRIQVPIEATGHHLRDLVEYLRGMEPSEAEPVMVVIPDPQDPKPIRQIRRSRILLAIKARLLYEPGLVVASVPFRRDLDPEPHRMRAPRRLSVLVLVSGVHRVTLRAIDYAKSLGATDLKAVTMSTDPDLSQRIAEEWATWEIDVPLEIVDSPYRSVVRPLLREIEAMAPSPDDAVAVVIPEILMPRWWNQLLHGQTALIIKWALLFRPNVIVIDVPSRVRARGGTRRRQELVGVERRRST